MPIDTKSWKIINKMSKIEIKNKKMAKRPKKK